MYQNCRRSAARLNAAELYCCEPTIHQVYEYKSSEPSPSEPSADSLNPNHTISMPGSDWLPLGEPAPDRSRTEPTSTIVYREVPEKFKKIQPSPPNIQKTTFRGRPFQTKVGDSTYGLKLSGKSPLLHNHKTSPSGELCFFWCTGNRRFWSSDSRYWLRWRLMMVFSWTFFGSLGLTSLFLFPKRCVPSPGKRPLLRSDGKKEGLHFAWAVWVPWAKMATVLNGAPVHWMAALKVPGRYKSYHLSLYPCGNFRFCELQRKKLAAP